MVDVASNKVHEAMTVRIEDGRFKSVKKSDAEELRALSKEKGVRTVDLNGLWLCPGLVDCRECLFLGVPHDFLSRQGRKNAESKG